MNAGFKDLGIVERPNLVVLKRTKMPAVLLETGFINNDRDNTFFDQNFDEIAQAIADGILETIGYGDSVRTAAQVRMGSDSEESDPYEGFSNDMGDGIIKDTRPSGERNGSTGLDMTDEPEDRCVCDKLYRVQVGAFRSRENADRLLNSLLGDGFPAFIIYSDGLYKVQAGAFRNMENAVRMERRLRRFRYNTFITT